MLAELLGGGQARPQRLDVLDLHLDDDLVHVGVPLLDEREEGAVRERPVRPAEREKVRELRHPDAEVRHYVAGRPDGAEVAPVADEGEAGGSGCGGLGLDGDRRGGVGRGDDLPGGVEAGGADDDVDGVLVAAMVDEPGGGDVGDGVGEAGGVCGNEGFQVSVSGSGPATPDVEVFGDDLVCEDGVDAQFPSHFCFGVLACVEGLLRAFDDELEALVELVLDHLPVLEEQLRVFFE